MADLNDHHRRSLAAALKIVQRTLNEFGQLVVLASGPTGRCFSPKQARELLTRITRTRQHLQSVSQRFHLPEDRPAEPGWTIRMGVAGLEEVLEGCKAERLRTYGEMDEATQSILDAEIHKLMDLLRGLADAAQSSGA